MGTAERRYEIMKILCRRRYETIRNLASEFGVPMRTVQRDIETLSRTEPIYTQFGKYACFATGVTAVPLSMRYGETHCNKILCTISPDAIIMDANGELTVYKLKDCQYIALEEHPALIMCTSGTTGKPKGAMLSEKNILTNVSDIADYFTMDKSDTILIARPLYHCAVLTGEFLTAIVRGANIRFYSEQFNPTKMLELIKEYGITAFCGTPTLLSIMARFNRSNATATLRHICISGECMGTDVGRKIRVAFLLVGSITSTDLPKPARVSATYRPSILKIIPIA